MHVHLRHVSCSSSRSHIPTSVFYDAWQCANSTAMYPMTLPNRECFETQIQSLGINSDTHVIVYDRLGSLPTYRDSFKSLPSFRAWWLFRVGFFSFLHPVFIDKSFRFKCGDFFPQNYTKFHSQRNSQFNIYFQFQSIHL